MADPGTFDYRRGGDSEAVEKPGAVSDVHVWLHRQNRFGHDLVDVGAFRRTVASQHLLCDVGEHHDAELVVLVTLGDHEEVCVSLSQDRERLSDRGHPIDNHVVALHDVGYAYDALLCHSSSFSRLGVMLST